MPPGDRQVGRDGCGLFDSVMGANGSGARAPFGPPPSAIFAGVVPLPPVVVEIAPPNAPLPLRQTLLAACGHAVHDSGCVEGEAATDAPSVVAIVSWRSGTHVRVDVALRPDRAWITREMDFDGTDAPEERWRAVGLAIGTLASAIVEPLGPAASSAPNTNTNANAPASSAPTAPAPAEKSTPPQIPAKPPEPGGTSRSAGAEPGEPVAPSRPMPALRGVLDAGGVVGPALNDGPLRGGGEIDGRALLFDRFVYGSLGVSYAESAATPDGVRVTFFDAFAGLALGRDFGRFSGVLRADGLARRLAPELGPGDVGPRSKARWLGGARLGAEGMFWVTEAFGLFVGADGDVVFGVTDIQVGERAVGTIGPFGYLARAGVSVGFR